MVISILHRTIIAFLFHLQSQGAPSNTFEVLRQVTGPIKTNCYLLYDVRSKEAALFDVGGPIDSLVSIMKEKNLKLKYIFATHGHMDHLEGVPPLREKFPNALFCCNKDDYQDFLVSIEWSVKNLDPKQTEAMKKIPATAKWFDYDLSLFGKPDASPEDNQIFKLGDLEIRTILSPGHSKASICYSFGDVLLSGDVLFYRSVGMTYLLSGSTGNLVNSVRRLYAQLPDETKVYPGHGQPTDIGSEKKSNRKITVDSVKMK